MGLGGRGEGGRGLGGRGLGGRGEGGRGEGGMGEGGGGWGPGLTAQHSHVPLSTMAVVHKPSPRAHSSASVGQGAASWMQISAPSALYVVRLRPGILYTALSLAAPYSSKVGARVGWPLTHAFSTARRHVGSARVGARGQRDTWQVSGGHRASGEMQLRVWLPVQLEPFRRHYTGSAGKGSEQGASRNRAAARLVGPGPLGRTWQTAADVQRPT